MKINIFLLILILSLFITGCSKRNSDSFEVSDSSLVTINGLEFDLTKHTSFEGLKYDITEDFEEAKQRNYVQYRYTQENGGNLLFFRIFYYKGKDIDYARTDLGLEESLKTTNGKNSNLKFKKLVDPRNDGTIHYYFIEKDKDLYVVSFISQYDIREFEAKVLRTLSFESE